MGVDNNGVDDQSLGVAVVTVGKGPVVGEDLTADSGERLVWADDPYGMTMEGDRGPNQDGFLIISHEGMDMMAVLDGVGGEEYGREAVVMVMKRLKERNEGGRWVDPLMLVGIDKQVKKGATTLVVAQRTKEDPRTIDFLTVGDSGVLLVNTVDRTVKEVSVRDEEEGPIHRVNNILGSTVRKGSPFKGSHGFRIVLKPGETVVLTTDCLTGLMDKGKIFPGDILEARLKFPDSKGFVGALMKLVKERGGTDDATVVSIPYK